MLAAARLGAALFLASLSYFGWFYLVWLGRPVATPRSALSRALIIDIGLFSLFALHHSVLARSGAKAAVTRILPRSFERSSYVWLASLLFLATCLLWQPVPGQAWGADGVLRWALYGLQAAGVVLTIASAARIDIRELAGLRQLQPTAGATSTQAAASSSDLEISGPYRWLRHPIYLGWILFVWCAPSMTAGRLLFAAISTGYLIAAIPIEERSLSAEFGPAYGAYQRHVRWRLVPGIW